MIIAPKNSIYESDKFWLTFSPEVRERGRQEYERYSNNLAGWNAYRNRLCLETFLDWLRELIQNSEKQPTTWGNQIDLPSFWEVLEGVAIEWEGIKIVLIPVEIDELEAFYVPGEWVDVLPADYYVAARVNLDEDEDESGMEICGYVTHSDLQKWGRYDEGDRSYCINPENLEEIGLMLVERKFANKRKTEVRFEPTLPPEKAADLIEELSAPNVKFPRLKVTFKEWGALLVNDEWRQQLYERRLEKVQKVEKVENKNVKKVVNLGEWFHNKFDENWQAIEELIETLGNSLEANAGMNLILGSVGRSSFQFRSMASATENAIPELIEILQTSKDKYARLEITSLLGSIAEGNKMAIAALSELIDNSPDEDLRRQAAVNLGKIDGKNNRAAVRRGKKINLGIQLEETKIALVVTLMPEINGKINVHLRVYPIEGQICLPPNLELNILGESGETLRSVKSRAADNAIQLELRGDPFDSFQVKVALGKASFIEEFVI